MSPGGSRSWARRAASPRRPRSRSRWRRVRRRMLVGCRRHATRRATAPAATTGAVQRRRSRRLSRARAAATTPRRIAGQFEPLPSSGRSSTTASTSATLDVPVDYADPDGPTIRAVPRPLPRRRSGRTDRHAAREPGRARDSAAASSRSSPSSCPTTTSCSSSSTSSAGTRAAPARASRRSTASTTTTPTSPSPTSRPTTDAEQAGRSSISPRSSPRSAWRNNADILEHVGTNNTRRDMDVIRRALGEETISYFGFSYGSELGATWATLFPDTVRATVIDGAADPDADPASRACSSCEGFEARSRPSSPSAAPTRTARSTTAATPRARSTTLMAQLDATPIPSAPDRPRRQPRRGAARGASRRCTASELFWPALAAVAGRRPGRRRRRAAGVLRHLLPARRRRHVGQRARSVPAINCIDTTERPTVAEERRRCRRSTRGGAASGAGRFDRRLLVHVLPTRADPRIEITGAGAGPIVVSAPPATRPRRSTSTQAMADALEDGRLVVVEADQHTGYGVNACVIDVVNDYLIDLAPARRRHRACSLSRDEHAAIAPTH